MTDQEIAAIRERLDKVVSRNILPWQIIEAVGYIWVQSSRGDHGNCAHIAEISNHQSGQTGRYMADFIAASPADLATLLAEVERLKAEIEQRERWARADYRAATL